jgi:hypothetical protein
MIRDCSLFVRLFFSPKESAEGTRIAGCKERKIAIDSDNASKIARHKTYQDIIWNRMLQRKTCADNSSGHENRQVCYHGSAWPCRNGNDVCS